MELRKDEAGILSKKPLKEKLMDNPFTKNPSNDILGRKPGLCSSQHRKQIADKDLSETFLDSEQALPGELGTKPLTFTFVPSVRRLPAHFQIVESSKLIFKSAEKPNRGRCEETLNKATLFSDYLVLGSGVRQATDMQDLASHRVSNNQQIHQDNECAESKAEEMQRNDVFQAEFVLITDSDDGEEEMTTKSNDKHPTVIAVVTDHRQARIQSLAMPSDSMGEAVPEAVRVGMQTVPEVRYPELSQDALYEQKESQLTSSLSTTDQLSYKAPELHVLPPINQKVGKDLANLNQACSSEESLSKGQSPAGPSNQGSSAFFQATSHSPSCSITHETETLISRSPMLTTSSNSKVPIKIQMKAYTIPNSFYNIHGKAPVVPRKNQIPSSHFSSETEISNISVQSSSPNHLARSSTLSPISFQVTTHSLCPSPKPLEPPFYGSSSSIHSTNEPFSPGSSNTNLSRSGFASPLSARLSFLTSVLKTGTSTDQRKYSPEPSFFNFSSKSPCSLSLSPYHKSKSCPTIFKKPSSKFTIGASKQKEAQTSLIYNQTHNQFKILPLPSEHIINSTLHATSLSPAKCHTTLSSSALSSRSSAISSSREKIMSPALLRTSSPKTPSPTPKCISPLHLKPPLNKETQHPLKRIPLPVKSRKVPMFSPIVSSSVSHSFSPTNQRVTFSPTSEKVSSPSKLFHSTPFLSKQTQPSLSTEELTVTSPSYPDYDPFSMTFNIHSHSHSPYLTSLSPYPDYRAYSVSPRPEQSPTTFVTHHTSPIPIQSPSSRSALSRSSELSSAQSLSQSPDHETKKPKEYKIKSSYKALAAIPTNTLLLEQKALDDPVKTPYVAEEDTSETHSELCSPAQLRQQTDELCAAIDKVLQDPLPMHHHDVAPESPQVLTSSDAPKMLMTMPRTAGRETRYTKPGVIRPLPGKAKIILKKEEACYPNPFNKYVEGTSRKEMQHLLHSTTCQNKSDLGQHDGNGKINKGTRQKNERTPYCRRLLMIREDLGDTSAKQSKGKK
ncbi:muscular LMNA-interacting protein isoform X2 [Rhinatrema bivittatum]|uniref:muscular LMNA-interacting protein isoform X2 n=1 Tax=Rhinatrema bivittatum TaxID=194408 RepID=UPI0011292D09|nr:muscular LMNA-interacting protein isoform X2 [Rhinatrema bivittatum]